MGNMKVVAAVLKDYSNLKVARMETNQNYVPPVFERKQYTKETEYYWVPPSLAPGEWAPELPVKLTFKGDITPDSLLRQFKKHTLSHWSLKEALEAAEDRSAEILGYAKAVQRDDDRADDDKQKMIKKMMGTLKKEKGLVDVGEMMNLKKAAEEVGSENKTEQDKKKKTKPAQSPGVADKAPTAK